MTEKEKQYHIEWAKRNKEFADAHDGEGQFSYGFKQAMEELELPENYKQKIWYLRTCGIDWAWEINLEGEQVES